MHQRLPVSSWWQHLCLGGLTVSGCVHFKIQPSCWEGDTSMVVPVHIQTNQAVEKLASIPGATIRHILLPLLVPPYSTYCFHSWCHLTAHIASTPSATLQHTLLPLLVPPYSTYCFYSWCHLTAHIASTPGAAIQHILLPLLVPPYSTYCFHSWCHLTAHIASTPGSTLQHILLPLLVPPYSTYCFHFWCHCGGPRYDQSRIRLNTYRACARMHSGRFYLFWRALT